jgi:hypothetical protein
MTQPPTRKKRSLPVRIGRIVAKTLIFLIAFVVIVILLIQTGPVQNFLRKKAVTYLENKLKTRVEVGRIYIGLPKNIILENIYVEDRQKDTLLSGGKIKVNLNLLRLAFKNEIDFKSIELENITAKVKRQLPDTSFNFQFIVDAFVTPDTATNKPKDTSATNLAIRSLELNKIRLVYNDIVSGSDMEAWIDHLDTKIDKFDIDHFHFDVPQTNISGINARIYQVKPLARPEPEVKDMVEAKEPITMTLDFKEIDLKKIKVDFRNDVSAFYTLLDLGSLELQPENIDLANRVIDLGNLSLENTMTAIRLGRKEAAKVVEKEVEQEAKSQVEAGWRISANSVKLNNDHFQFDNDNSPRIRNAMDYAHMNADSLTMDLSDLLLTPDSIAGKLHTLRFKEQSGFILNELHTDFLYTGNETSLSDLYLETPGTELKRSAAIRYASIEALQKDIGNMEIDLDLEKSKVLVKDVLIFAPELRQQPAFANPYATWYLDSRITGRLRDLNIANLNVQGLHDTRIDVSGRLTGLPDMKKLNANLDIREITSSRRDINMFLPKNAVPSNITLPSRFTLRGKIKGNDAVMNTDLALSTDLGYATVKGAFTNPADLQRAKYDAVIDAKSLELGTIMQNKEMMGALSGTFKVKGTGYDPKTANATVNGVIHAATINNYTYRNVNLDGSLANQQATANISVVDPNIHLNLDANADLTKEYPAVKLTGMIDSIKLQALNFAPEPMIFRGKIDADFASTDPNNLEGKLLLTQSVFVQQDQRLQLDTVEIFSGRSDSGRILQLTSDVMYAKIEGQYKLQELGNIFRQAIQPYFAVVPGTTNTVVTSEPYEFTLNAYIIDNPALRVFVPDLTRLDSVSLQSHFSDKNGWTANLVAPAIDMGPNHLRQLEMHAGTNQNGIDVNATLAKFTSGTNLEIVNSNLTARVANNNIDFGLSIKDRNQRSKYNIKGLFQQPTSGDYQFSFKPDSLVLNYDNWTVSPDNKILVTKTGINANNMVLSKNGQQLRINSLSSSLNAPMDVTFDNFKLATLTGFVQTDTTLANGTLNGKITFTDLATEPVFTGDLTVSDFMIKSDTVGNIHMLVNNSTQDTYFADVTLTGRGNDVKLTGNYYVRPGNNSNFDLKLDIRELPVSTAQALSQRTIRDGSGSVSGRFDVTGNFSKPVVTGDLNFNKARFNLSMLNSYINIDQEKIRVDNEGIHFDRFEIRDSAQNPLTINGVMATSNFTNYRFDLTIKTTNFKALNSTKKDNNLFYGQVYFNTDLHVGGTEALPKVEGRLVVNGKTKLTVVLPQSEPGVVDRDGVVEFVDMDAPLEDSLFLAAIDSLNSSSITGMDVNVNVEVDREAELSLIVDEGNGDFLNVKGEALLNAGIDPSGKMTLSGSYELDEGSYEITFNFIHRKFDIEKGSKLVWEGEPTDANVNITAKYIANAAPLDLVKNQLDPNMNESQRNVYLQKLPFDVLLTMEGPLLKPIIKFDIVLPEDKSYVVSNDIITTVQTRLDQLREEEGEMNKQVFSLLLMNRFVAENPFNSSGGTAPTAGALARQSVSKLLTEQLNKLADDLVAGVDLSFDVVSSDDYTSGQREDRTDLNVSLSKQLLNDRLTVSIGNNFELEGPRNSTYNASNIAGNVALDYRLSKDKRYVLRAYRKNEYEAAIEGYVIETGIGFIITLDYNRFSQIFRKRRERQQPAPENQPPVPPATTPAPIKEPENK